jgi:3-oxoacyl-[acyl-carrier protein] reductase
MSLNLKNKVVLITGGSRGIGKATALALAKRGAELIGVHYGNNAIAAQKTVEEIEALGSKAVIVKGDLSQGEAEIESIVEQFNSAVLQITGESGIDILVNNAGIAPAIPLEDTTVSQFDEIINVNFKAPFFLIQKLSNHLRENGRIINISTGFTRVAAPTHPAYAASKGAIETLTLALAPSFGARGITVNAIMPGVTETDMNTEWINIPEARAQAEGLSVFSRIGQTTDVADVIAFIASDEARWVTGQVIDATGGAHL